MNEIDRQFEISLKWANEILYVGFRSDSDFDRAQKIIESCAIYFASRKEVKDDN